MWTKQTDFIFYPTLPLNSSKINTNTMFTHTCSGRSVSFHSSILLLVYTDTAVFTEFNKNVFKNFGDCICNMNELKLLRQTGIAFSIKKKSWIKCSSWYWKVVHQRPLSSSEGAGNNGEACSQEINFDLN